MSNENINKIETMPNSKMFLYACESGNIEAVKYLLEYCPAYLISKDERSRSGLFLACENDHVEISEFLLNAGADTNLPDDENYTPLICACEENRPELAKMLIYHGANIYKERWTVHDQVRFNWGNGSAVQMDTMFGDNDSWDVVTEKAADIGYQNKHGETGLMLACKDKVSDIETILEIIEAGADINLKDNSGRSALDYLIENSDLKIKALGEKLMLSQIVDELAQPVEDETLSI